MAKSSIDPVKARALYDDGASDNRIAKTLGVHRVAVKLWREREALPALYLRGQVECSPFTKLTPAAEAKVAKLLLSGHSLRALAAKFGVSTGPIRRVRATLPPDAPGLLPWGGQSGPKATADRPAFKDTLYSRINAAVSRLLAADIRDDIISDTYLALLEGTLDESEIEARIKRFESRTIGTYASKWGPASLDEEIGDDGFSRLAFVADPNAAAAFDVALYRGLYGELPQ